MKLIMLDKINEKDLSTMEYVRLRILSIFFRGDIFGQAGRVRSRKKRDALRVLGDSIKGDDLEAEEKRRLAAFSM